MVETVIETVVEILKFLVRLLSEVFVDGVLEIGIRIPGTVITRFFRRNVDPESTTVMVVGVAFWLVVALAIYWIEGA